MLEKSHLGEILFHFVEIIFANDISKDLQSLNCHFISIMAILFSTSSLTILCFYALVCETIMWSNKRIIDNCIIIIWYLCSARLSLRASCVCVCVCICSEIIFLNACLEFCLLFWRQKFFLYLIRYFIYKVADRKWIKSVITYLYHLLIPLVSSLFIV